MALFDDEQDDDSVERGSWGVDDSDHGTDGENPSRNDEPSAADRLEAAIVADDDPHGTIKRAVDPEAGMVLYAYKNGNAGGLTAVPFSETRFADGE